MRASICTLLARALISVIGLSVLQIAHPDFFWVFVARTFYYMCISLQAFVLFMLRDVQKVEDPTYCTSLLAMIGQFSAAIIAIPSGHLSDIYGRKPLVWMACGFMAVSTPLSPYARLQFSMT